MTGPGSQLAALIDEASRPNVVPISPRTGVRFRTPVQPDALPGTVPLGLPAQRRVAFEDRRQAPAITNYPNDRRIRRRRASMQQGQALEKLGHAVEYLADSRLFLIEDALNTSRNNQEAIQILMRMSMSVFGECREVVSVWERLGRAVEKLYRVPERMS